MTLAALGRVILAALSVVIPVYRSEHALPELLKRLVPALTKIADAFELLLIDDGSDDGSWRVIEASAPMTRGCAACASVAIMVSRTPCSAVFGPRVTT